MDFNSELNLEFHHNHKILNFLISKEFNRFHRENDRISKERWSLEFKPTGNVIKCWNSHDLFGLIKLHRCW